jgi:DNA-binding NarL/FixJ family response regulator
MLPSAAPLALAIVEDQPDIRATLTDYLCAQPELRCVLIADSIEDFFNQLPTVAEPPRVILCDIGLPGLSGIAALPLFKEALPAADVLMLSVFQDAERVFQALCAGAVGYLVKDTPLPQLKENLLQVAAGGSPMSPAIARHVVRQLQPVASPASVLTARELQVVRAIEDGLSYKLIADRLHITLDMVRNHIRAVYRKLQVNSKAEVVAHFRRSGR